MTLSVKTTHVEESLAQLAQQLHDKPKVAAFLSAFVEQVQELEDALHGIVAGNNLDTAVGEQLAGLGSIVGEPANGRDDETYRLWIRSRIRLNQSSGLAEELYGIFEPIMSPAQPQLEDLYPAAFHLTAVGAALDVDLVTQLSLVLAEAKAAAVGAYLIWSSVPDEEILIFEDPVAFIDGSYPAYSASFGVSGVAGNFPDSGPYYVWAGVELISVDSFDGGTFDCSTTTLQPHELGDPAYLGTYPGAAEATAGAMPIGNKKLPVSGITGTFPAAGPYLIYLSGYALQVESFDGSFIYLQSPAPVSTSGSELVIHLNGPSSLGFGDASYGGGGKFMGVVVAGESAESYDPPDTLGWLGQEGESPPLDEVDDVFIGGASPPF